MTLTVAGSLGSPYTRKLIAMLRYRHLIHRVVWVNPASWPATLPVPSPKLLPVLLSPMDDKPLVDTTPIIQMLEGRFKGRSVRPTCPLLASVSDLIEDYADEWLVKSMFHYRWHRSLDADHAAALLALWHMPINDDPSFQDKAGAFAQRQIDRLPVVGSSPQTAVVIEASYERFLQCFLNVVDRQGFLLGGRPCAADFAIIGQLSQLVLIDLSPAQIARTLSPKLRAWTESGEDLSGLEPTEADWIGTPDALRNLRPLFCEIGATYAPAMVANARAYQHSQESFETEICGEAWSQKTFPYQAKCLGALRASASSLSTIQRQQFFEALSGTGCEQLFTPQ